jgi:hypothetical protein
VAHNHDGVPANRVGLVNISPRLINLGQRLQAVIETLAVFRDRCGFREGLFRLGIFALFELLLANAHPVCVVVATGDRDEDKKTGGKSKETRVL